MDYNIEIIMSIQTLSSCLVGTLGQYIYQYYFHSYVTNSTITPTFHTIQQQLCPNNVNSSSDAQQWAQQQSSNLFFWQNLASSLPVIIMTYLLGIYTSKLGKKIVLILPILGTVIQLSIWLAIIYFNLKEYWWLIAAFIQGLSGSGGVFGFIITLIITDTTLENDRSARFVRLGAMCTLIAAIASLGIGYWIEWRGFVDLYWIALALQILCLIIVLLFINNNNSPVIITITSIDSVEETTTPCCRCNHLYDVCTVFRPNRSSRKKSISLLLTLFAHIFHSLASLSFTVPFLFFLLNSPFCWSSKNIGIYSTASALVSSVLRVVGMKLLQYMGSNDPLICAISHIFLIISALWTSFAKHSWELYVGILISPFTSYQASLTYSMLSKWLEPHETANTFALVTEISTIISAFGTSFFNFVYSKTIPYSRNFTMLLAGGLAIIPLILNICLYIITRNLPDTQTDIATETTPLLLPDHMLVRGIDPTFNIISASSSLTNSLRTPTLRSRSNSAGSALEYSTETEPLLKV